MLMFNKMSDHVSKKSKKWERGRVGVRIGGGSKSAQIPKLARTATARSNIRGKIMVGV